MHNTAHAKVPTRTFLMEVRSVPERIQRWDKICGLVVEGGVAAKHREAAATRIQLANTDGNLSNIGRLVVNDGFPLIVEREFEIPVSQLPVEFGGMSDETKANTLVRLAQEMTADDVLDWVQDL